MRQSICFIVILATLGCDSRPPRVANSHPEVLPSRFDPQHCGHIAGRVWWAGPIPNYPPMSAPFNEANGNVTYRSFPHPNAIHVNSRGAVVRAVVMLEGVSPESARPWHPGKVRIAIDTEQILIHQGDRSPARVGFVNVGEEVEIVSIDDRLHVLSARGAAFFGLAFPTPHQPLTRRFDKPGLVELSSGSAHYWHRAHLWVGAHPYFALSDAEGRFELKDVPDGEYDLTAWHPSGDIASTDLDPNTGMVLRHHFASPMTKSQRIRVVVGAAANGDLLLTK